MDPSQSSGALIYALLTLVAAAVLATPVAIWWIYRFEAREREEQQRRQQAHRSRDT